MRWLDSFVLRTLVCAVLALGVAACSSSSKSNRVDPKIDAYLELGQGGVEHTYAQVTVIQTDGRLQENEAGEQAVRRYASQLNQATYLAAQASQRMHLFEAISTNPSQTKLKCQWSEGCGDTKFGDTLAASIHWRAAVWNLGNTQRISVNPITELATQLAQQRSYEKQWLDTGHYFSPQSLVQSVSQLSKLFGFKSDVGDIQSITPADFSQLAHFDIITSPARAKEQLYYGALLSAWQHLDWDESDSVKSFISNNGQLKQQELSSLYQAAADNLTELEKRYKQSEVKPLLAEVKYRLIENSNDLNTEDEDALTNVSPGPLDNLFMSGDYKLYSEGLSKAKDTVEKLNALSAQKAFIFDEPYKDKLDDFKNLLEGLNQANNSSFDNLLLQLIDVAEIARLSQANNTFTLPAILESDWVEGDLSEKSFKDDVLTFTVNGHKVTATLSKVASNAKATDVQVHGTFESNGLQLVLNKPSDPLEASSKVRVFADGATQPLLGVQQYWNDFSLEAIAGNDEKFKLTGKLSALYRGVVDPNNENERHYNVDHFSIDGTISSASKGKTSLKVSGSALQANDFFDPTKKFGSFSQMDNFIKEAANTEETIDDLVTYQQGTETLDGNREVDYVDVRIKDGKATRYRFYPEQKRDILNNSGQKIDFNYTFDLSTCSIEEKDGSWQVVGTCSPKTRFQGKRDIQKIMNNLWRPGALSYITVPNQGEYFVEWPASPSAEGCYELDELEDTKTLSGEQLEKAVLGLNSLELSSTVELKGQNNTTSYVLNLQRPTVNRINLTSALTYENKDAGNSSKVLINYNTNSAFKRTGNFSISNAGVNVNAVSIGLEQEYSSLPHKRIIDEDGNDNICVISNDKYKVDFAEEEEAVYSLTYRGAVYGTIRFDQDKGEWKATFSDGSKVDMPNFENLLTIKVGKLPGLVD